MAFGIKCPVVDYNGPWWGGRAIFDRSGNFDLPVDRQEMEGGTEEEEENMTVWLINIGFPHLRKVIKEKGLFQNEDRRVVISRDGFTLVANPNKSFGYLYLGCWVGETEPDQSITGPLIKKLRKGSKWYVDRIGWLGIENFPKMIEVRVVEHNVKEETVLVRFRDGTKKEVFLELLFKKS